MSTSAGVRVRRRVAVVVAALLALALLAGEGAWLSAARTLAAYVPAESVIRLISGGQPIHDGSDERLTVLLLGGDSRGGGIGRTDALMVASVKGNQISLLNIPRDMSRIPLPGGGTYNGKINGMVADYGPAKFKDIVAHFLAIEIDHYVIIKFKSFEALMGKIEPLTLNVRKEVRDNKLIDDPNRPRGVYFPRANSYRLYERDEEHAPPSKLCNGLWKEQSGPIEEEYWCNRALPFVRSRKGPSNSDFARATRQQDLVMAAIRAVTKGKLDGLVGTADNQKRQGELFTDIPINDANALALFNRVNGAGLRIQVVLSPSKYASSIPGSTAFQPNLPAIRALTKEHFGGRGSSSTPAPTQQPTPKPTATRPPATPAPTTRPTASSGTTPTATPTSTRATPTATTAGTPTPTPTVATGSPTSTPTDALASPSVDPSASVSPVSSTASPSLPASPTSGVSPTADPGTTATASPTTVGGVVDPPPTGASTPAATGGAAAPLPSDGDLASALGNPALLAAVIGVMLIGGLLTMLAWRRRHAG